MPIKITDMEAYKNQLLTNFAQGYRPVGFKNRLILPGVPVYTHTGNYLVNNGSIFQADTARGIKAKAKNIEISLDSQRQYAVKEHTLGHPLDKRQEIEAAKRISSAKFLDLQERTVKTLKNAIEVGREVEVASIVFGSGKYDSANKKACIAAEKWNVDTADINAQIKTGRQAMYDSCGIYPNAIVMGTDAYNLAISNAKLRAMFQNIEVAVDLTDAQLKQAFKIDYIFVCDVKYTNKKGVLTQAWDSATVSLLYIPTPEEQALGIPVLAAAFDLEDSVEVNEYDEGEVVRITSTEFWDINFISGKNAYLISGVK